MLKAITVDVLGLPLKGSGIIIRRAFALCIG